MDDQKIGHAVHLGLLNRDFAVMRTIKIRCQPLVEKGMPVARDDAYRIIDRT